MILDKIRTCYLTVLVILFCGCGTQTLVDEPEPIPYQDINNYNISYVKSPVLCIKNIIFSGDIQGKISCRQNAIKVLTKDSVEYKYSKSILKSLFNNDTFFSLKGVKKSINAERLKYVKLRTAKSGSSKGYTVHFNRAKGSVLMDTSEHKILKINSHLVKKNKPKIFKLEDLGLDLETQILEIPGKKAFEYYDPFLKDNIPNVNLSLGCKYSQHDSTVMTSSNMKYYSYNREILHSVSKRKYYNPFSLPYMNLDFEVVQELAEYYLNKNEILFFLALNLPVSSELSNNNFEEMEYKITNQQTQEVRIIQIEIKKFECWKFSKNYRIMVYPSKYEIKEKDVDGQILKKYTVDINYAYWS